MLRLWIAAATAALLGTSTGQLLAGQQAAAPAPSPSRQAELLHLLRQDCGSCHGLTLKGGLGPSLLPAALVGRPDEVLVETILDGRRGTPMPPWSFAIRQDEAAWLVRTLREGTALPGDTP